MRRASLLCRSLIGIIGIIGITAAHSSVELFDEKEYIHEEILGNGVSLLVRENHSAPIVQVNVFVKTGSIHEGEYVGCGISHHIEHIVSGGSTRKRTEAEYEEIRALLGGACNAYTTTDHTCYHIKSSAEHLPLILEVLSEWTFECLFDPGEFTREHGVIQREIEMGMEEPARRLWKLTMSTMFKTHPAGYPTIGYLDNFLRLTREDLVKYYDLWYVPENTVLVVAGDVERDHVVQLVKETFGRYPRRSAPPITLPDEPRQMSTRTAQEEMDVDIAYMMLAYRTIPLTDPDLYPLDLLSYILTRGESAILVKKIRDEMGLVSEISSYSSTPGYDAGYFAISVRLAPEEVERADLSIREELERLKQVKIEKALLDKAKKQKITEYVFDNQTVAQQAANIARWAYLTTHNPYFYAEYVKRMQDVTPEDIRRVLRQYLTTDNLTVAKILPKGYGETAKEGSGHVRTEEIEKATLENGMTLLTRLDESSPMVTLLAVYKGGVVYEKEQNGVSNFMVRMLCKGTERMSAEDIAEAIDNMGVSAWAEGGNNAIYLGFDFVSSDFDEALSLFADIIQNPAFPPVEMDRMRDRLVAEVARREGDWYDEAADFFRESLFTRHPYRYVPLGTRESLEGIAQEDLIQCYSTLCTPDNMVLAIFGDIDGLNVAEKVKREFAGYHGKDSLSAVVNEVEPELTASKTVIKYTEKDIAVIYMGYPGMCVKDLEDRYAMEVLDAVVSGINYPGGWLHETLRGNELVYVIHAFNWIGIDPGYFAIYAATTPDQVDRAVELILLQMERIKSEDIADEEFERAKGICITMEKLSHESNDAQALRSALDELYGLGYDFYTEHEERIRAITEEDVRRVAGKYLRNYVLAITQPGDGSDYEE